MLKLGHLVPRSLFSHDGDDRRSRSNSLITRANSQVFQTLISKYRSWMHVLCYLYKQNDSKGKRCVTSVATVWLIIVYFGKGCQSPTRALSIVSRTMGN